MPPKTPQTLSQIIDSLLKPLTFASKDNFAHLHTVKGMEHLVESLCKEAAPGIDASGRKALDEMILIFKGFDGLTDEAKKERIKRAIEIIEGIKKGFPSPQPLPKGEREQKSPSPQPSPQRGEGEKTPPLVSLRAERSNLKSFSPLPQESIPPLPVAMASRNGSPVPLKKGGTISTRGEGDKKVEAAITPAELAKNLEKLRTPLQYIKGIGPKLGERLAKKGLSTVEDILYYLPMRYEDRRNMKQIAELSHGQNEVATGGHGIGRGLLRQKKTL